MLWQAEPLPAARGARTGACVCPGCYISQSSFVKGLRCQWSTAQVLGPLLTCSWTWIRNKQLWNH